MNTMIPFSISCLLLAAGAVSGAVIHVNEIKPVPRTDGLVTTAGRPSLDNGMIAFGQTDPNNVGVTFDCNSGVLQTWGGTDDPIDVTRNVAGFFQNEQTGIGGRWAVVGGAPEVQSLSAPIKVIDLETKTRIDVYPDPAVASASDQHFYDINTQGDLVWVNFGPGTESTLVHARMEDPTVQQILATVPGGTSQHPRISTESGRRITYSPSGTSHRVFDLDTMTDHSVYESTTGENVLRSRISDDGNWVIANHRPAGETQKKSDIILINVTDLDNPVSFNLTKDPSVIREDPNIEIVDADSAIIVWGQDGTPDAEDNYDIYAAVVTGLSAKAPVLGQPVLLAAGDGESMGNRFPVIDDDFVAWSHHWGNPESATVQYMKIAEAAPSPIPETTIVSQARAADSFEVTFATAAGFRYIVEYTDSLGAIAWTGLPAVNGIGSNMSVSHPGPLTTARFYRVRVERP
ncbi:MAG: hypothetical protein AB9869_31875 [Verrucomicrobiia bacterium]